MPNENSNSLSASVVGVSVHTLQTLEKATRLLPPAEENSSSDNTTPPTPIYQRIWTICCNIYGTHSFLIKALVLILLAFAYPPLGAIYFVPEITATWIAVIFIFVLAGMGIKTEEFAKAFQRLPFNVFVQVFNFGAVSSIVYGFSRFMVSVNALSQSLADGMTICASLPIAINVVLLLTRKSEGDEAAAIFNVAIGNLVGVFVSPALILMYLGVRGQVDMRHVIVQLGLCVLLPVFVGQVLQHFVTPAKELVKGHGHLFKTAQERCLLFIIYTVFCKTFMEGMEADMREIFLMIALQFFLLCVVMMLAWICLRVLFRNEPRLQAMGLFGCTNKTMASGIPLINAIYGSNPMVGLYTLPLLIWHPMQLVVGSFVAPYVAAYVKRREDESDFQEEEKVTMALPALV